MFLTGCGESLGELTGRACNADGCQVGGEVHKLKEKRAREKRGETSQQFPMTRQRSEGQIPILASESVLQYCRGHKAKTEKFGIELLQSNFEELFTFMNVRR